MRAAADSTAGQFTLNTDVCPSAPTPPPPEGKVFCISQSVSLWFRSRRLISLFAFVSLLLAPLSLPLSLSVSVFIKFHISRLCPPLPLFLFLSIMKVGRIYKGLAANLKPADFDDVSGTDVTVNNRKLSFEIRRRGI